jgi:16S rRNA (cytosine967-C5)-methyltransferase
MAGYELVFLDKIPTYATVNWAVEWIKKNLSTKLAGLGNAVLRRVAGLGEQARQPDFFSQDHSDLPVFLARYYSCPQWIVQLWLTSYGEKTTRTFLSASISQPPLGLRCAPKQDQESLMQSFHNILLRREGLALALTSSPENLATLIASGHVTRQSFAAQAALAALEPSTWPTPIWDACCGRGGKSMALDDQGIGPLLASDLHRGRLHNFARECAHTGRTIPIFRASAKETPPLHTPPRTILLDVPCSGLGVLSRRPDSKWKRTPKDVAALIKTQETILDNAWNIIPYNGLVVYLTCTLNPGENQEQIARLCRSHDNAVVLKEYQTGKDEELGEFFYGAVIRKTDDPD